MTKIRILSDLHYVSGLNGPDDNKSYTKSLLYHYFGKVWQDADKATDKAVINLFAGDIIPGTEDTLDFYKSFFPDQQCIFVEGNHLCYVRGNSPHFIYLKMP